MAGATAAPVFAVPEQRGLALVGDADGGDVAGHEAGARQCLDRHHRLAAPERFGIVLDPARLRIVLRKLLLRDGDRHAGGIEDDGARTGRPLVKRE